MFTADMNGQITVWDTKTQEPIVFVYQTTGDSGSEYIFLTPDHYYKATPGINRHINFVKDGSPMPSSSSTCATTAPTSS